MTGAGECQGRVQKVAEEQRVEPRGREKEKKRGKRRKASGWRAKIVTCSCFVCGAANQDEDQQEGSEQGRTGQEPEEKASQRDELGSYASVEENKRNEEKKQEEKDQTGGTAQPMATDMTEEDRLRERKESRKASMQRFLKLVKDERKAYKNSRRSEKLVEVNMEWSTLSTETDTEDAMKKVSFCEEHLCDVWLFQREPMPSQRCRSWRRTLERIRQREVEKKELLRGRDEGQHHLMSSFKALLAFSMAIMFLCFCSLKLV